MSSSTARLPGESELKYIARLGTLKDQGILDMTWTEISEILNRELRDDPSEYYSESAYRKKYALMKQVKEEFEDISYNNSAEELVELRRELEKEKVKLRDERNEYRRLLREEARKESYIEQFTNAIVEAGAKTALEYFGKSDFFTDNCNCDLLIPLYDLHSGIEVKNFWNEYNTDILNKRLNHYLNRIIEIAKRHGARDAYVVCSELLSGLIHPILRIENNQDLIDQFLTVTDYVCEFLAVLSQYFECVNVYVAPGNHSRITPKKDESLAHENMDNLLIPFLQAKLQNYKNVICHKNDIEQSVAIFPVRNMNVFAIHGDKDSFSVAADNMRRMFGIKPNIILTGHRHTNALMTDYDTKVVQSGCLSGSDQYCIEKRLNNRPEQAVCVISETEGLDCIYDIKF